MAADKPTTPKPIGPKLVALLVTARELHAKQADLLAEMDALLGGGAGIGADLKRLLAAYDAAWCCRYAPGHLVGYVWNGAKDTGPAKRLIKQLGVEELEARITRYLVDSDPFYTRYRHPFGTFVSMVNRFTAPSEAPGFELVADCQHNPPCASDVAHTRKRAAELRA